MARSPSNSGVLRKVGDVVPLERDPGHDCVAVQAYGDGDGVQLIFEGSLSHSHGFSLVPLKAEAGAPMPVAPDGRFAFLINAASMGFIQVRLAAIAAGSVNVALYSGMQQALKAAAAPPKGAEPKPYKLQRAEQPKQKETPPVEDEMKLANAVGT